MTNHIFKITNLVEIQVKEYLDPKDSKEINRILIETKDDLQADVFFEELVKYFVVKPKFTREDILGFEKNVVVSLVNIFGGILGISEEFSLFNDNLTVKQILLESYKSCFNLLLWSLKSKGKENNLKDWFEHLANVSKTIDKALAKPLYLAGFWISPNLKMDFHGFLHGLIRDKKNLPMI